MKKNTSSFLWGGLLILIGFFLAGRALDLFEFTIFFDGWWSLFIIVPCFIGFFSSAGDKTANLIGLCIGVFLLLSAQDIIEWSMFGPLCLAAVLVLVGLKMILPNHKMNYNDSSYKTYENQQKSDPTINFGNEKADSQENSTSQDTTQNNSSSYQNNGSGYQNFQNSYSNPNQNGYQKAYQNSYQGTSSNRPFACTAVLSGRDLRFDNEVFHGAMLSAVLGGIEMDLRNAIIRENVVIEAKTVLGGIDIFVPNYVRVVVNCTPILGGVDNKTITPYGADEKTITIYLNATCVLGGIDVK